MLFRSANKYLNEKEPWKQIKVDRHAAATTIYVTLQVVDRLKVLFAPFLPFSSQKLHEYLGYEGNIMGRQWVEEVKEKNKTHLALRYDGSEVPIRWEPTTLKPGQALRKPKPLFRKLDPKLAEEEVERMLAKSKG